MPVKFFTRCFILTALCISFEYSGAQVKPYTHADSIQGTYSPQRAWWDVLHYDLHVSFSITDSSITGYNNISFKVLQPATVMQLDLMQPMQIDSIVYKGKPCRYKRDGSAYFVELPASPTPASQQWLRVAFHGKPKVATNPPWNGGLIWAKDKNGNPWVSVACQGMAASVWFPNKDHMADEPDSARLTITCPIGLIGIANGRIQNVVAQKENISFTWGVKNPINNYNIIPYIGKYANIKDTFNGAGGVLDLDYWVLGYNYDKAGKHFGQVKTMLRCFEEWFGPYPFYNDGYKLVEAPFLGMEHQSAIAYGNNYQMGYQGRDLSRTGWGLKWDFIIVHESGHEWFGNNISAKDVADNWIHESFTAHSENLYVEYLYGKKAGSEYVIGTRASILNDKPVIANYNVNHGGSYDQYYKGANMLHTMRQIVNNDSLWKMMLRGLNKTFKHQTVSTKQIETYMSRFLMQDFQKMFDQYLRTVQVPVLEYKIKQAKLYYRWNNCVKKFNMPVKITSSQKEIMLKPLVKWQKIDFPDQTLTVDTNYYIFSKKVE